MPSGLFELRKDPITSWWVATVVDRAFHRDRFARAAEPVDDRLFGCANCGAPGDGVRPRVLKDFAFHVVGTDEEARELDRDRGLAQVSLAQARATGSWRTVIAPTGEHRPLHAVGRTGARRPERGRTTCASTSTTCPRSRTASPRSWVVRLGS